MNGEKCQRQNLANPASDDWHGEGQALALRYAARFFFTVARGPVPRERSRAPETVVRARLLPNGQERGRLTYRSAGACPPRSPDPREKRTPAKAVSRSDRGMARDRPSPYGMRHVFFTVARGPVPRDRSIREKISSGPLGPACL